MKKVIENDSRYNSMIEPSDWRYSAAIVGLLRYFKYLSNIKNLDINYEIREYDGKNIMVDSLFYNDKDINEDNLFSFLEYFYKDQFHHIYIENKLKSLDTFDDTDIKEINEKLAINSIMKQIFNKKKFDGTNKEEIIEIIDHNRKQLTLETFRNKLNMYRNYCNPNLFLKDKQSCCRLNGYYIDCGKKSKSIGYSYTKGSFVYEDDRIFDFIPFAFDGGRETFFINDNIRIKDLIHTNDTFSQKIQAAAIAEDLFSKDSRRILFESIIQSAEFIDYDVEIITKNMDNDYFENLYIRKQSIEIIRKIKNYGAFCFSYKVNDNCYINVQKEVINCILNHILVDSLIEMLLKSNRYTFTIRELIALNIYIKGGSVMDKSMLGAYACAKAVVDKIPENKVASYRNKLISSIVFKDYNRVNQILLQLSNYSDVAFGFAYDLFEDFEGNKELAYTFINALRKNDDNEKLKGENSNGKEA